ncbi:ankyrin repeat domain-containing protein SOWAHB [Ctenodactylus gundi]
MARELSQEALLDFLCQAGGRVTNAALLSHFRSFLRDPDAPPGQHQLRRELFKGFVNSVAAVRQDPDGTKYVVLRRRYRDLLGEEAPQRPPEPRARPPQDAPRPPQDARRAPGPGAEPAGPAAGGRGRSAGCAREAAGARGRKGGPARGAPGPAAAQAGARCAAAQTHGRCCWECLQNGVAAPAGNPPPGARLGPASAEEPARAPPARDPRRAQPAAPRSPPAPVRAAASPARPAAPPSRPAPPRDPPEPQTPGSPHHSTLRLQQQRTREWVARHPPVPEARDQGPARAWSVLPDSLPQLPSDPGFWVAETSSTPSEPALSSPSLPAAAPGESSESWLANHAPTVFRSIRCQLSLQDLDDFVDQDSHGSEESSSGPKESPGGSEDGLRVAPGTPEWGKLRSTAGRRPVSAKEGSPRRSPGGLRNGGDGGTSQQVPTGATGLAGHPREPLPWPTPRWGRSFRRSSLAGRAKLSSSDEEYPDEDLLKRSRRPPRPRKTSRAGAVPSPRGDVALTLKLADIKASVAERGRASAGEGPAALIPHRPPEHRSSLVPLDAKEHEWIVRLASGSWVQVLTLFWEDPQLALHKDFLTGYTALHWIAKHGNLRALQDFVSGAQKAGIVLDVNVRSGCGYTPLHLAAIHGHQGVIKLLVQRLASRVNVRDSSGKKPWQYLTSSTSGEIWQLLGAPRGKPIFPVHPLVQSSSPTRKTKHREVYRNVTRRTSLAALLKSQHSKWKSANQYEKFSAPREREEYSD